DRGTRTGRALIAHPHPVSILLVDEAEPILAATHRTRAIFSAQEARLDPDARQDEAPLAMRAFLGGLVTRAHAALPAFDFAKAIIWARTHDRTSADGAIGKGSRPRGGHSPNFFM